MRLNSNPLARRRAAFTMVELLIVIVIIGLIAGITLVALRGARTFTGAAVVRQRLDDIGQCLEIYKQKYGEYPPDCTASDSDIQRHILKRWPNALKSGKMSEMVAIARAEMDKGPGCALLFWLAGPDVLGTRDGFYADDRTPIFDPANVDDDEPREAPVIELTYDSDGTGGGNYNELGLMYKNSPIIYFRADGKNGYQGKEIHTENGVAAPYMKNGAWYNPETFQLIYAGDDGAFGADPFGDDHEHEEDYVPRDLGNSEQISPTDRDNITNFSNGATLDSEVE